MSRLMDAEGVWTLLALLVFVVVAGNVGGYVGAILGGFAAILVGCAGLFFTRILCRRRARNIHSARRPGIRG